MEISMFTPVFYKKLAPIFAFMTLGLVAPMKMLAQVDTGAISGTVKDTSGAVIPGAKVAIINEDTGLSISTTSGSEGEYVFSPVKIGHYSVSAEIKSFQQNNVTVAVQQRIAARPNDGDGGGKRRTAGAPNTRCLCWAGDRRANRRRSSLGHATRIREG